MPPAGATSVEEGIKRDEKDPSMTPGHEPAETRDQSVQPLRMGKVIDPEEQTRVDRVQRPEPFQELPSEQTPSPPDLPGYSGVRRVGRLLNARIQRLAVLGRRGGKFDSRFGQDGARSLSCVC